MCFGSSTALSKKRRENPFNDQFQSSVFRSQVEPNLVKEVASQEHAKLSSESFEMQNLEDFGCFASLRDCPVYLEYKRSRSFVISFCFCSFSSAICCFLSFSAFSFLVPFLLLRSFFVLLGELFQTFPFWQVQVPLKLLFEYANPLYAPSSFSVDMCCKEGLKFATIVIWLQHLKNAR